MDHLRPSPVVQSNSRVLSTTQVVFFVQTIGRSMQLYLQLPVWDTPHPPGLYMLIGRLSIAAFAFLLSLYTYRSSWRWVWNDVMHPI